MTSNFRVGYDESDDPELEYSDTVGNEVECAVSNTQVSNLNFVIEFVKSSSQFGVLLGQLERVMFELYCRWIEQKKCLNGFVKLDLPSGSDAPLSPTIPVPCFKTLG